VTRAHVAARDADFADMMEAIERARRAQQRRVVLARFFSRCDVCRLDIEPGTPIAWRPNAKATHAACFVGEVKP
jgi:hypothetical protein